MLESILVYTFLLVSLPFLAHSAQTVYNLSGEIYRVKYWFYLFLIILIFTVILGSRYDVGIDYLNYKQIFEELQNNNKDVSDNSEPGFLLLCKIIGWEGNHYFFFFSFFCCLQVTCIVLAFRKTPNILSCVLIILIATQLMVMMNLVRQITFVCIFIYMVSRIDNFNFYKFLAIVLGSTLFIHRSAILVLPIYPLIKSKQILCGSHTFQITIFLIAIYMGFTQFILDKFEKFDFIASLLGYKQYTGFNVLKALFMNLQWGPRTWIRVAIVFMTILTFPKLKMYFHSSPMLIRFYNLFFWGECAEMILFGTNVFLRVFLPMIYTKIIVEGYCLYYFINNYKISKSVFICSIAYIGLIFLDYCALFYEASLPDSHILFRFFWQI